MEVISMKISKYELEELIREKANEELHKRFGKVLYDPNLTKKIPFRGVNEAYDTSHLDKTDDGGFDNITDFLKSVRRNDIEALRNCIPEKKDLEAGDASGMYLIPEKYQAEIIQGMEQTEIIRPRAVVHRISRGQGTSLTIPGVSDTDYSSDVAGVTVYWKGEGSEYTESDPTLRQIMLTLKKATAKVECTEELVFGSAIDTGKLLTRILSNALSFELDKRYITGNGAGLPLGITNAPCLKTVSGEGSQDTDTLNFTNICNMMEALHPASWNNAIWLCSNANLKQLLQMSIPVGTGGSHIKVLNESNGQFTLLGRPVLITQHCAGLGEANSIMLVDPKQYVILQRDDMMIRVDPYSKSDYDIIKYRLTFYTDGQPIPESATTLANSTEVSPFVSIEAI
jgi:HK97 family phage major capsid protein